MPKKKRSAKTKRKPRAKRVVGDKRAFAARKKLEMALSDVQRQIKKLKDDFYFGI